MFLSFYLCIRKDLVLSELLSFVTSLLYINTIGMIAGNIIAAIPAVQIVANTAKEIGLKIVIMDVIIVSF